MGTPHPMMFWAEDWLLSDTIEKMSAQEERGYFRLLLWCWIHPQCSIENDRKLIRKRTKVRTENALKVILEQFETDPNDDTRLINKKLYSQHQKVRERQAKLSESGKLGNARRWQGDIATRSKESIATQSLPKPKPKPKPIICLKAIKCAEKLRDEILKINPEHSIKNTFEKKKIIWAKDIEKLHNIDGVSYERINEVIDLIPQDKGNGGNWKGWGSVILSGFKLRKHFEELENIKTKQQVKKSIIPSSMKIGDEF